MAPADTSLVDSPTAWVMRRYLPLAWASWLLGVTIYLWTGGRAEVWALVVFAGLNAAAFGLKRLEVTNWLPLHQLSLAVLALWYCTRPDGVPAHIDEQIFVFTSLLVLPHMALVSLYGLKTLWASGPLGLAGLGLLAASGPEFVTGVFLLVVSALVGALFHQLLDALEAAQDRLRRVAFEDPLTRIGNRRAFEADFAALVPGSPVVSVWDVDGLKAVNDLGGHAAGDAYLQQFVAALEAGSCPSSRLYRLGGDEFAGIHPPGTDGELLAERVRSRFPNVSVGVVEMGDRSLGDVMAAADEQLYRDKRIRSFYVRSYLDLRHADEEVGGRSSASS